MNDDPSSGCQRTYVTLRIYPGSTHPDEVSQVLGVTPTRTWVKADPGEKGKAMHGWFLTTRDCLDSRDCRLHIDWLLLIIKEHGQWLEQLRHTGGRIDIIGLWQGNGEQGGPRVTAAQMAVLGPLGIDIAWNIYHG